jgi:AraC-like DNA-binding protein
MTTTLAELARRFEVSAKHIRDILRDLYGTPPSGTQHGRTFTRSKE